MKRLERKADLRIQKFLVKIVQAALNSSLQQEFPIYREFRDWEILIGQIINVENPNPSYSIGISTKGDGNLWNGTTILKAEIILGMRYYKVPYYNVLGGLTLKQEILEKFETG